MNNVVYPKFRNHVQITHIKVLKGRFEGDDTPRWFVIGDTSDGGDIILADRLSPQLANDTAKEEGEDFSVDVTYWSDLSA